MAKLKNMFQKHTTHSFMDIKKKASHIENIVLQKCKTINFKTKKQKESITIFKRYVSEHELNKLMPINKYNITHHHIENIFIVIISNIIINIDINKYK